MATVTLEQISKAFGATCAVNDFSATIADGEFVTFLGPSGCGKTTCLRMIAGFIEPTQGRVLIGARVVSDPARKIAVPPEERGVGMVFQSYAVWPHMTVFANVAYPLKVKAGSKEEQHRRVGHALELMKMSDLAERYPHQLSGGQQQRVALARALVMNPQVLLLDEPLSNLDAKLREEMRLELKQLQKHTGVTIIFVTHDQMEAMVMADRIVVMNAGVIQQIGAPREIYLHPANRFVGEFIGVANFLRGQRRGNGFALAASPQIVLPFQPPAALTGDALVMMVRPQDITLHPHQGHLAAQVMQKMFVGDATEYFVAVGGEMVRVRGTPREDYAVGATAYLTITAGQFFR
ncbi:MAG: ABC transporter ATP-binding protein [Chloroflexota bacterium]